jgi:hypothetical protein
MDRTREKLVWFHSRSGGCIGVFAFDCTLKLVFQVAVPPGEVTVIVPELAPNGTLTVIFLSVAIRLTAVTPPNFTSETSASGPDNKRARLRGRSSCPKLHKQCSREEMRFLRPQQRPARTGP